MADPPEDKKRKEMTELQLFDELFPVLVEDLTKNGMKDDEITSAIEWFKEVSLLIVCIWSWKKSRKYNNCELGLI